MCPSYFLLPQKPCPWLFLGKYQLTVGHSTEVMLLIDCTAELDAEQLCPEMLTASWKFKKKRWIFS